MSDSITIARPYAKAIFEHALSVKKLSEWTEYLHCLALTVLNKAGFNFITNPATTVDQHRDLLMVVVGALAGNDKDHVRNFVEALAANKRLQVLPDIAALYEVMRAEQEKTIVVNVSCFTMLSTQQQQDLKNSLGERLQRKVTLNITIDKELIGGAVINAGDLVIDGSVRGKINKLRTGLAA